MHAFIHAFKGQAPLPSTEHDGSANHGGRGNVYGAQRVEVLTCSISFTSLSDSHGRCYDRHFTYREAEPRKVPSVIQGHVGLTFRSVQHQSVLLSPGAHPFLLLTPTPPKLNDQGDYNLYCPKEDTSESKRQGHSQ